MQRKIRLDNPISWPHHRSGWGPCARILQERLSTADGVLCLDTEERIMHVKGGRIITEDFLLISHLAPVGHRSWPAWSLAAFAKEKNWLASKRRCRGVIALTRYASEHAARLLGVPCDHVLHPTTIPASQFSWEEFLANADKRLIMLGCWLRRYSTLMKVKAPGFAKVFMPGNHSREMVRMRLQAEGVSADETTYAVHYLPNRDFDIALSRNIVLLDLFDASANNTVIECIARRTPLLARKIAPVVEYLGEEYPFYFESLAEAEAKLQDADLMQRTCQYLDRDELQARIDPGTFARRFAATSVYRAL